MVIIDDSYKKIDDKIRGRKPKIKFQKDGIQYIFKYGAVNYEIWSELLAEQLGKQVGINMAQYRIACYNGTHGLLTPSFVLKSELIFSSDYLKKTATFLFDENNLPGNLKENSIINIVQSAYTLDSNINTQKLSNELMKRWLFSVLIMESDKNETNIGFIKSKDGLRLAPDYDNSSMARLNENINNFIDIIRYSHSDIRKFTDEIKSSFFITEEYNGVFLNDFVLFIKKYPIYCEKYLRDFSKIDITELQKKLVENGVILHEKDIE